MENSTVSPLSAAGRDLEQSLMELIELVRAGKVTGIAGGLWLNDGPTEDFCSGEFDFTQMTGRLMHIVTWLGQEVNEVSADD